MRAILLDSASTWTAWSDVWSDAREAGGVIDVAGSAIAGRLGVETQRSRACRAVPLLRSYELRRGDALFDPGFERVQRVERARPRAATAMPHAGHGFCGARVTL
jgi:hypothetical protein